ncbi:helix-turn-helix transcriptional regulator [Yinghuangia sp. ASG 101]|uniref:helix-turn-helix transcriptional regulator n=1 Tax=Yinghuangia sp. ASG 101 TaxID=2896848 RepID=UPI001E303579|nr:helix-turn-helix transcriptional regulator [Yinghuangia sp. ASG 101]UGQ14749.1 helix-turn-helix transcriptional regulator [Yinghuangia sp. ASG 101]
MRGHEALGDFLRSRRARIRPEEVGFASGSGQRRVPGLRREELAHLAGVSVDYYVRLEQGRSRGVSEAVLDAVADALRLDDEERGHLRRLARPDRFGSGQPKEHGEVRPGVRRLLSWLAAPALVMGPRMDVLAWNRPVCALITDFGLLPAHERNLARLHLLDATIGSRYPDREMIAREAVGHLRAAAGHYPDDAELRALIDELTHASPEFRRHWARHEIRVKAHGTKRIDHPDVGPLTLAYEITRFPQDADLSLLVYTAEPGSAEESALRTLARTG